MKKFIIGSIIFLGTYIFTFTSCSKNETSAVVPVNTLAAIKADPSLTIFSVIESLSGDDSFINNSPTLLIPVDSAFINAGITASVAASLSPVVCDSIVKYYITAGSINLNGATGIQTAFASDLGPSIFVDSTASTSYFDGIAALSQSPTIVGNSSIYKLTKYINVPVNTIAQITAADTSLTLFNEAFNRTNLSTYLAPSLGTGRFTLLMPTNMAFINAGLPNVASIDAVDITTLTKILLYHVCANNFFANDLANQSAITTLQGGTIQITNNGNLFIIGNSNPSAPASLLNYGTMAGNVLAYKINSVLLP